ncbi:MAG: DUF502 domain-containing protein [Myxococcota bacterium]|nr:DUF502 domain-containing protein [Myxococcota bacterium]
MKTIVRYFFQGLLVCVPLGGTIALVVWILSAIDRLYPLPIPGLGLAITLTAITLVGALTHNVVGRRVIKMVEAGMRGLPVVNIIYTSIKDLLGAFVGDKRSFDKPVMVRVQPDMRIFGFVTCDRFDDVRLAGHVAVYLPQSYNFAGNLIIVKKEMVEPVDADSAQFMAFIVSGGVATMNAARTQVDSQAGLPLIKRKPPRLKSRD